MKQTIFFFFLIMRSNFSMSRGRREDQSANFPVKSPPPANANIAVGQTNEWPAMRHVSEVYLGHKSLHL